MLHRTLYTERPVTLQRLTVLGLRGHQTLLPSVWWNSPVLGEFYKLPEFKTGRYPVRPVLGAGLQPP